jgi:hypothetical protein
MNAGQTRRNREQQAYQFGKEMQYKAQSDDLERKRKEREFALTKVDTMREWENKAANRDSTLSQLYSAQAQAARLAAAGDSFARHMGRTAAPDAGGAAQARLMALLGNATNYSENVVDPGTTNQEFATKPPPSKWSDDQYAKSLFTGIPLMAFDGKQYSE